MASGPFRIGDVSGSAAAVAAFRERLRSYPQQVIGDVREILHASADEIVEAIKARVPVSDLEAHSGDLKASVHKEDGRHDLSVVVLEDARDAQGRFFAAHVEYGHKTKSGSHVAPRPHFWPTVAANRPALLRAMARAMRRRATGQS